jgi:GMP synthase (glutamine-hydrolysing)
MSAPRLLVLEHEASCPPGYVGDWLLEEGVRLDVRRPYRGDPLPGDLASHAGLLVLGGEMGAYDDATHPWLAPAKELVRIAVAHDTPVWGICLGHQLMTVALGGTVHRNPAGRASGLTVIGWADASAHDPLCAAVPREAHAVQWNDDVAERLPDAAEVLATAPDGTSQVVRFGPRAWGVQFHPEVGGDIFAAWAASARRRDASDTTPDLALETIRAAEPQLRQTWQPMAKAFAAQLA